MRKLMLGVHIFVIIVWLLIIGFVIVLWSETQKDDFGNIGGDWHYDLPNQYKISHVNSRSIVLTSKDPLPTNDPNKFSQIVCERYVVRFCYSDRYVGLQCTDVPDKYTEQIDRNNTDYYLFDTNTAEFKGPFTQEEYELETADISQEDFTLWIETDPKPEGAHWP